MNPAHRDELVLDIGGLAGWLSCSIPPTVVAAPTGFESAEQLVDAAQGLVTTCHASLLIAKSRHVWIDPLSPAGNNHPALHWLREAKDATGLGVAVEVANTAQVEVCLADGADVLLVGARVTADPRIVNEVAAALRGVQVPVLVENASEPDVALWAHTLELLNGAGVCEMAAIHRGFFFSHESIPRYQPRWEIPIELKRMAPHLPMFCEISSAIGDAESLRDVAQAAMDLDMDGLVADVCIHTSQPYCESSQTLTVPKLVALISMLEVRNASPSSMTAQNRIDDLRKMVDSLDRTLLGTLSKRQDVVDRIARLKKDEDVTVLQLQRWREIVSSRSEYGRELGLDAEMVQLVFEVIHNHAIARQRKMLKERSAKSSPSD